MKSPDPAIQSHIKKLNPLLEVNASDKPNGVWLKENQNGFESGGRIFVPTIGLIFLITSIAMFYGMIHLAFFPEQTFRKFDGAPYFYVIAGIPAMLMLIQGSFYLFGKFTLRIKNDTLILFKGVGPLGFRVKMPVSSVKKINMVKVSEVRISYNAGAFIYPNGKATTFSDRVLIIEGSGYWRLGMSADPEKAGFAAAMLINKIRKIRREKRVAILSRKQVASTMPGPAHF